MVKSFYESLNELVTDSRFRNLSVAQNFENILSNSGMNESENMYMYGWLINPNASHGLQDVFLKELIVTAWTNIHCQQSSQAKILKSSKFFTTLSPLTIQNASFNSAFVDTEIKKEIHCADIVITDISSKVLLVINNKYNKANCDKAHATFTNEKYRTFENKVFLTCDIEAQATKDSNWIYVSNEWLINLCANIIECPQYASLKVTSYLKDYYQFLTGSQHGTTHQHLAENASSLITDYYATICDLKKMKAEKIPGTCLIDINPRDCVSIYEGKITASEQGVLTLFWSYRNTFNTFFQVAELEAVTRNLESMIASKPFSFDRSFIRNGLKFTPAFNKAKMDRAFINTIFDVEMIQDTSKNLVLSLVVNKCAWDKLSTSKREIIQKNFDVSNVMLKDRVIVWNSFYKQDWKNKDLCNDIVTVFEKVDSYLSNVGLRVA